MKYLLISILSGLFFGLGNIITKLVIGKNIFYLIFLDPLILVSGTFGAIAFLLSQIALKNIRGSIYTLLATITMTIVSVIGGNFLGEVINSYEIAGIFLMTASVFIILFKK